MTSLLPPSANPGMSAWAALVERAHLVSGDTVLSTVRPERQADLLFNQRSTWALARSSLQVAIRRNWRK